MGANGENPRTFTSVPTGTALLSLAWSPDGRRIAYLKGVLAPRQMAIEVRDLGGGEPVALVSTRRISDMSWSASGRFLYSTGEAPPGQDNGVLWEVPIDPQTGRRTGEPRRLAKWVGQYAVSITQSADGRRIAVSRMRPHADVYLAELVQGGAKLDNVRRLTLDDRANWPSSWAPDGRALLLDSDRNGDFDLFSQGLTDQIAKPLMLGAGDARSIHPSPDGRWYFYLGWPIPRDGERSGPVRLLKFPASGGPPSTVLEVKGPTGTIYQGGAIDPDGKGSNVVPDLRCPTTGNGPCVLGEAADERMVFTTFDAAHGRLSVVGQVDVMPSSTTWDLSPDGSRLAVSGSFKQKPVFRTVDLHDKSTREIPLKEKIFIGSLAWSADGRSLLATNVALRDVSLYRIELDGLARVLWTVGKKTQMVFNLRPSPDGKRLAFGLSSIDSNVWLLENAPAK